MVIVNIKLTGGHTYNTAKNVINESLRGSIGYIKNHIRIRPVPGHSDEINLELGDSKTQDLIITTTLEAMQKRTFAIENVMPASAEPEVVEGPPAPKPEPMDLDH